MGTMDNYIKILIVIYVLIVLHLFNVSMLSLVLVGWNVCGNCQSAMCSSIGQALH